MSFKCEICDQAYGFRWTDTHGIAVCVRCGAPYRIFHYDEDNKRVEKGPESTLNDSGKEIARRYWNETGRRVFPGIHDMGIFGGRNSTFSGATKEESKAFNEWYLENIGRPEDR